MAARKRLALNDKCKEKIKTGMLIKRLQDYAVADVTTQNFPAKVMMPAQVKAALGLLAKVMPDLQRTQLEGGDADKPVRVAREMSDDELAQLAASASKKR